ncbi:hypothetical protein RB594_006659 [Gaeumannomyces avenae]
MAEVEETQFSTLAERIAALNRQKNFQSPSTTAGKRPPPPPPPNRPVSQAGGGQLPPPARPDAVLQRSPTVPARPAPKNGAPPLPRRSTAQVADDMSPPLPGRGLAPPLPTRRPSHPSQASQSPSVSQQASPALPPRKASFQRPNGRRNSNESDVSYVSTISNLSLGHAPSADQTPSVRRLPPALDQANLPPLPPTRRETESRAREAAANGVANGKASLRSKTPISEPPARPSLPPRLPSRPARSPAVEPVQESAPVLPRRLPPRPTSFDPPVPARPKVPNVNVQQHVPDDAPPPVPLASRPTDAQIEAAISSRTATAQVQPPAVIDDCLICRDFSQPDAVAAQYPLHALPRHNVANYLAQVLCGPFSTLTDKARAIFTWCHHNIRYDVEGLFGNCIPRGLTPDQTILSGKAVCEGYAKVYQNISQRAGLECVVVGGHGKGYGFHQPKAGEAPPPRDPTGHAWNAVRLDDGSWKLLDACWGAGHLGDNQAYNQKFDPLQFTMSNELFGLSHFPSDSRQFFREDGRVPTWEEYVMGPVRGEKPTWYNDGHDEGLSEHTVAPAEKHIAVQAAGTDYVRFQFSHLCEHWKGEVHGKGKPRLLALKINGRGGRGEEFLPLDTDGYWWWIDVPACDLGNPGQNVAVFALNTLGDAHVTKDEFLRNKGRIGTGWSGIAGWELV